MTKVYFPPVHLTHYHRTVLGDRSRLPITEKISRAILSLPFHADLTEQDAAEVIEAMKRFYQGGPR
jgi:perosamine synthetase